MKKSPSLIVAGVLLGILLVSRVFAAVEFNISGNAADSQNTINFQQSQSTNIQQSNQGSATTEIDASADTGGNAIGGGGGSVKTGDASVNVKVTNQLNTNQANVPPCCPAATPTPTIYDPGKKPTPTQPPPAGPTLTPTPTSPPAAGGNGKAGGAGGGGEAGGAAAGVGGAGVAAGEVLGLSAASGEPITATVLQGLGLLCLVLGGSMLKRRVPGV